MKCTEGAICGSYHHRFRHQYKTSQNPNSMWKWEPDLSASLLLQRYVDNEKWHGYSRFRRLVHKRCQFQTLSDREVFHLHDLVDRSEKYISHRLARASRFSINSWLGNRPATKSWLTFYLKIKKLSILRLIIWELQAPFTSIWLRKVTAIKLTPRLSGSL